jgi:corrinoid protein of di/trimethylamine methyltransferase
MRQSIIDGAADTARTLAEAGLQRGMTPLAAIHDGYVPGMHYVGEQFAQRHLFLPDMVAAAEAMKAAMSVLEPELKKLGKDRPSAGTVILGTAKGDIHEIGKTLVGTLLGANGFTVHDLGVDVSAEKFAAAAQELRANVVGVSALLTTTMKGQKSVIELLDREGLRPRVKVIIGGAPVTRQWSDEIRADGFAKDAVSAVNLVQKLLQDASQLPADPTSKSRLTEMPRETMDALGQALSEATQKNQDEC